MNLRAYYLNSFFFINFNFDFGVLTQKCLKPCENGVLKFQFFFLNLSSKVLAGVGVRTSKYLYMDICATTLQLVCQFIWLDFAGIDGIIGDVLTSSFSIEKWCINLISKVAVK